MAEQGWYCLQGLQRVLWSEALDAVQQALGKVQGNEIRAIAGKLADAEGIIALKVQSSPACGLHAGCCLLLLREAHGTASMRRLQCPSCACSGSASSCLLHR